MDDIKDANDLLRAWVAEGVKADEQVRRAREMLDSATPVFLVMTRWAAGLRGSQKDEALERLFRTIAMAPKMMVARYRSELCETLGLGVREFNNILKAAENHKGEEGDKPLEIVETLGGWIPEGDETGWLVEYIYDEGSAKGRFAYRDAEGKVGTANYLDIGGIRYVPKATNQLIRNHGVLFPSDLGQLKTTRELVSICEAFIKKYFLLDDIFFGRLAAYYVLLTWLYDCFSAIPYLRARGDYGTGKSELMERIGFICYRMMSTGGAGSAASLFRAIHEYRGTVFMDEMDLTGGGDMDNDLIKILNLGAMKGRPVWRLDNVVNADGTKDYEVASYDVYGPKLITMRKTFRDMATESRCLTTVCLGRETTELVNAGIPLHKDEEFYKRATAIRNLLLRWRLEKWQLEIKVGEELMDLEVPARLNQVTTPIKAIAVDDPDLLGDITTFVRALNRQLILERSMSLDARVLDALVAIKENPAYKEYLMQGDYKILGSVTFAYTKYIAKVANDLMDEMNIVEEDGEDEDGDSEAKKKRGRRGGTTSQTVGRIARQTLNLQCHRLSNGYIVIYDDARLRALKVKYGIEQVDKPPNPWILHANKEENPVEQIPFGLDEE